MARAMNPPSGMRRDEEDVKKSPSRGSRALLELKTLGFDFLGAFVILLIIIGSLYAYTDNWPPLVVVQSGSMQHSEDTSYVGVIDTGDLVFVKDTKDPDSIIPYLEGREKDHRTYGSYGDVIIFRPNGEEDRTAIIHRAVAHIEWNDTNYNLPTPLLEIPESFSEDLNGGLMTLALLQELNSELTRVKRQTFQTVLSHYPDDPNIEALQEVYGGQNMKISTYIDFFSFTRSATIESVNVSHWRIEDSNYVFELKYNGEDLTLYGFFRMGGGYDVQYMAEPYNHTDVVYIDDYEWPERIDRIPIDLGYIMDKFREQGREPHSGFITKGDKNQGIDQTSPFDGTDQPSWIEPIKGEWVIGKSVGEVPWFGIIKLKLEGKSDAPKNSFRNLIITVICIIALPFIIDLVYNTFIARIFKGREDKKKEPEDPPISRKTVRAPDGDKMRNKRGPPLKGK